MLDGNLRTAVDRALIPIGRVLQRIGITADVVTVIGIAMSGAAAVAIGRGNLLLGFILLILTGIPDALDGAVAKAAGTSSKRGAFFDSVSDRLTDALLFGGLTWHYVTTRPGHLMMLPVAVMASAQIISYQRAKAELLGYEAKGGVMERAERFIVLALGLLLSVIIGDDALLVVLWIMLALTLVTAIQRFIKVWIQATAEQKNEI
tara:strand:- start:62 stop:676 length:615 start_codon:yes stop_codon:yes gene_type:complete